MSELKKNITSIFLPDGSPLPANSYQEDGVLTIPSVKNQVSVRSLVKQTCNNQVLRVINKEQMAKDREIFLNCSLFFLLTYQSMI